MKKKDCSISNFERTIMSRLEDDRWDNFIANQVIHLKHEQNKRRLQLIVFPVIVLTVTTLYFSGNFFTHNSKFGNQIARQKENRQDQRHRQQQKKQQQRQYDFNNNSNQDYIIETVFTQFQ